MSRTDLPCIITNYRRSVITADQCCTASLNKAYNVTVRSSKKQECIPVGCVPAARRPYARVCSHCRGGGVVSAPGRVSAPGGVCSGGGVCSRGGQNDKQV